MIWLRIVLPIVYLGIVVMLVLVILQALRNAKPRPDLPQPGRPPPDDTIDDIVASHRREPDYRPYDVYLGRSGEVRGPGSEPRRRRPNRRRKSQKERLARQKASSSTWHDRLLQEDDDGT